MKKFLTVFAALMMSVLLFTSAKPKEEIRQALFQTNIHCKNCAAKIQDNVAFEKGVKDLSIDVDAKTVTITYKSSKTDAEKLCKAIGKLGYNAVLVKDKAL